MATVRRYWRQVRDLLRLLFTGHAPRVWRAVTRRLYSTSGSIGLRRDLRVPFAAPTAKLPIQVRPLTPGDDLAFLDVRQPGLSDLQADQRLGQVRMLQSGLRTCYLAIGPEGKPCYMQWLVPASANDHLRATFGNLFPHLGPDEALLEGAYTPEPYRGQGIMASAMAQIAAQAAGFGARWVITFVDEVNVPSLKGCERAGFAPYVRRVERYRLFRRKVAFVPLLETPAT